VRWSNTAAIVKGISPKSLQTKQNQPSSCVQVGGIYPYLRHNSHVSGKYDINFHQKYTHNPVLRQLPGMCSVEPNRRPALVWLQKVGKGTGSIFWLRRQLCGSGI